MIGTNIGGGVKIVRRIDDDRAQTRDGREKFRNHHCYNCATNRKTYPGHDVRQRCRQDDTDEE
jgi:hypothetical protein